MAAIFSAAAASSTRFAATMPRRGRPVAEEGAIPGRDQVIRDGDAAGLACLTMTIAGRSNSATHSYAASVSLMLL
jgi:hypothetical protein